MADARSRGWLAGILTGETLALVAVLATVVALAVLVAPGSKAPKPQAHAFAGYNWEGRVSSVQASWTVPEITDKSSCGAAATWVGADGPGTREPFIQVGTNEICEVPSRSIYGVRVPPKASYWSFWSDTAHHDLGQELFELNPGDEVKASLVLSHGLWRVTFLDRTSGEAARFTTRQEADASFDEANWTQEDLQHGRTLGTYPRTTPVRFQEMRVDSEVPRQADLESKAIYAYGTYLAPTPLHGDSFTLRYAKPPTTG